MQRHRPPASVGQRTEHPVAVNLEFVAVPLDQPAEGRVVTGPRDRHLVS